MKTRNASAVWLEKYNRWQIKVTNEDGVRKTFTCPTPGRKGQTECNRKADAWLASGLRSPDTRCGALIEEWLADMKKRNETVTLDGRETVSSHYEQVYKNVRNWILPQIEFIKIGKLRLYNLQEIIDAAYSAGRSKKTMQNIRGALSLWLSFCRKKELTSLVTEDLEIPADAPQKEKRILQPDDLRALFSSSQTIYHGKVRDEWYIYAWRFAVVTGLRPGELIALERKHLQSDRVLIRGSINCSNVKTRGKNDNAVRSIALFGLSREILTAQMAMLRDAGIVSNYVFPAESGLAAKQATMRKAWYRYSAYNGILNVTPYELRHTFVSISSARSNLSLSDLRATVGHSQNMDTLGTYSHKLSDAEERISAGLENAFSDILHGLK